MKTLGLSSKHLLHDITLLTDWGMPGCKMMFGNGDNPFDFDIISKHLDYFQLLNCVVLTYTSNGLFTIIQCGVTIFNMCIYKNNGCGFS